MTLEFPAGDVDTSPMRTDERATETTFAADKIREAAQRLKRAQARAFAADTTDESEFRNLIGSVVSFIDSYEVWTGEKL